MDETVIEHRDNSLEHRSNGHGGFEGLEMARPADGRPLWLGFVRVVVL